MHTKSLPMEVFRHGLPMVTVKVDKDTREKVTRVFGKKFVCHETTQTLEGQHFRDRETGDRKHPIERCGLCKLVEWCYQQAILFEETRDTKKPKGLSFVTPIFKFEGDDPKETQVLHVGGIAGLFNKELTDAQKEELKASKISAQKYWQFKENMWAKSEYAMIVVDNAHIESGLQIAVEGAGLGSKVKKAIEDEFENGVDIQKTPYLIKWKYFEKESNPNDKYQALVLRKEKPSGRVLALIRGDVPDLPEDLTTPFNQQSIRATLERHCLLPKGVVPWDEFFPTKEQSAEWAKQDAAAAAKAAQMEAEEQEHDREEEGEPSDDEGEFDEDGEELFECSNAACKKPVKLTDKSCPHCGEVFEVDEDDAKEPEPEPEPEKPKMRSRSEAKAAAAKKTTARAKTEEVDPDEVPFD